jgi:hypothetical protein
MQTQDELVERFQCDINRIVTDFIDNYALRYEEEVANLSDPLLRWFDFVIRYILPSPRKIFASNKFPKKLNANVESALRNIEKLIQNGDDINPYQSKGLTLHNDTSANKRQRRTDFLWADWGIHHLHLTNAPISAGSYFSDRSNWLLFCLVGSDFVCFIDIRNHGESDLFSDPDLIKTLAESWPEIMERYRIKGVLASPAPHTAPQIPTLRKGGVSSFVTIGSHVYMGPGMGVTSASTPTRVSMAMMNAKRYIRELAKIVFDPASQFKKESAASGVTDPEYGIALTKEGLAVHEKKENKAFVLPRGTGAGGKSFLAELHDLIAPVWAIDFVLNKSGNA